MIEAILNLASLALGIGLTIMWIVAVVQYDGNADDDEKIDWP